mmetsp:Transcript_8132/g.19643  ORF Transcript_8132/g.19643 Transcript_8132/m.19643 type:complete len:314 (-) Transcript_8132:44-985(-)
MAATDEKLQRYRLIVSYNGAQYQGFQRQNSGAVDVRPNKRQRTKTKKGKSTIQETIEDALQHLSGLDRLALRVRFSSRTDSGVHARGQVLAVSLPPSLCPEFWQLRKSINSRLPKDISVDDVTTCAETFEPREHVLWKRYSYTLKYRRKVVKDGELLPICSSGPNTIRSGLDPSALWVVPWVLDDSKLDEYCEKLTGEHDYSVFVHKHARRERKNVLTVNRLVCTRLNETKEEAPVVTVRFDVEAKGFRRSMVRNLIGFLVDICMGSVDESIFEEELWLGKDVTAAKLNMAPAAGLCLEYAQHDETKWKEVGP